MAVDVCPTKNRLCTTKAAFLFPRFSGVPDRPVFDTEGIPQKAKQDHAHRSRTAADAGKELPDRSATGGEARDTEAYSVYDGDCGEYDEKNVGRGLRGVLRVQRGLRGVRREKRRRE